MRTIEEQERIVEENVPISQCQEGDQIWLPSGCGRVYGNLEIVKIKSIIKDRVQIKCKSTWGGSTLYKIQKVTLPATQLVKRTRLWVKADGDDKGIWRNKTIIRPVLSDHQVAVQEMLARQKQQDNMRFHDFRFRPLDVAASMSIVTSLGIVVSDPRTLRLVDVPSPTLPKPED